MLDSLTECIQVYEIDLYGWVSIYRPVNQQLQFHFSLGLFSNTLFTRFQSLSGQFAETWDLTAKESLWLDFDFF